ncbi:MAG: hypothetical protein IKK63_07945 [Clostridia bacterium]|nr:hypothetical protein [Clostridia bacterium]MBR3818822.1 hypothetical protein [Clostridia bacterium]
MKNKFTSRLCVFMCFILILSTFAACSVKQKVTDTTTVPTIPNNEWAPGIDTYVPVAITDVELVQLVSEALGDEASGFNGDLSTLTPEQLEKVENLAADKGLVVEKDENNNTVIKKEDVPATNITPEQYTQIMNQVSVKDPNNISPSEYVEISKVAATNNMVVVTKPGSSQVAIVKPVSTTRPAPTNINPNPVNPINPTPGTEKKTNPIVLNTTKKTTSIYVPQTPAYVASMGTTRAAVAGLEGDWTATAGTSSGCTYWDTEVTADGGTVAVGFTYEYIDGSIKNYTSAIISKYSEKGKLQWTKIIGGTATTTDKDNPQPREAKTTFENVTVLSDGSIIAVGETRAEDLAPANEYKCLQTVEGLVVKFNSKGDIVWTKLYGGSRGDILHSVHSTPDGGFVIGGKSESSDADLKDLGTKTIKAFIFKCDANGNIQWRQALSGSKHNTVEDLEVNPSGEVFANIATYSGDGEFASIPGTANTKRTTVVAKFSPTGNVLWKNAYYDSGVTNLYAMEIAHDGGVVIAGNYSLSANGNREGTTFEGMNNGGTPGTMDGAIIKINSNGTTGWITPIVGFEHDFVTGIVAIPGGYAVSGYTKSTNRDFNVTNVGDFDGFVYTLSTMGKLKSIYGFGGSMTDNPRGICSDGKVLYVCGSTNSSDGVYSNGSVKSNGEIPVCFISRYKVG